MDGQTGTRDSTFEDQITAQKIAFCKVGMYLDMFYYSIILWIRRIGKLTFLTTKTLRLHLICS